MQSSYWKKYIKFVRTDGNGGTDAFNLHPDPQFDDDMYQCERCGEWFPYDYLTEYKGDLYCEACLAEIEWENEGKEDEEDD